MPKSTQSRFARKAGDPRPAKPYPDFPLFPHRPGYWPKIISGKMYPFGRWGRRRNGKLERLTGDGWKDAVALYQTQRDDIYADRTPRKRADGLTVRELCNEFLTVQYGLAFQRPSKMTLRQVKAQNGEKTLEAEECQSLIRHVQTPELRAMILLALNCGFGNSDCAKLPASAVDLQHGWISFPRPKTGIARHCPLWPETIDAIKVVLQRRGEGRNLVRNLVFVTKYGRGYERNQAALTHPFRRLLDKLGLHRKGLGFQARRVLPFVSRCRWSAEAQEFQGRSTQASRNWYVGHGDRQDDELCLRSERQPETSHGPKRT